MDVKKARILVTGGTGCIGKELINILQKEQFQFVSSISRKETTDKNANYFYGDICDYDFMEEHIKNCDILVHMAAKLHSIPKNKKEQNQFYETNVKASENIFQLAAKYNLKKVIFISSVAVLGDSNEKLLSFYAKSKLNAEQILLKIHSEKKLPFTILRPTTVFGKGDKGNVAKYIKLAHKKIGLVVNGGNNQKSFIYSKDVARAILETIKQDITNAQTYEIKGFSVTLKDLLQKIKEVFNLKFCTISVSQYIIGLVGIYSKNIHYKLITLGKENLYDCSKFNTQTSFEPEFDLTKGLADSYDYYSNL
jgi:nucleoside-diphosphate-sugar epimerase